jgi:hypothetical protein
MISINIQGVMEEPWIKSTDLDMFEDDPELER